MKAFRSLLLGALVLAGAMLVLGPATPAAAQTPVPAYTTVVADAWSDWYWDCGWWDHHWDYDWWWGPSWYHGADWYSGWDWTWTPTPWWYDYLYSYYCHWVWVEIYGTSLVQVPGTNAACTYSITVNFSDGSVQHFTQQGNSGTINLWFSHSATDAVPANATATMTCPLPPDLRIKCNGEDVTNATKTLVIGEAAQFTVEVGPGTPNVSISSVQWSQPPGTYKDYTFTIAAGAPVGLSAADLSSQTLSMFYISPRSEETLTATVGTNQGQAQVSTRITVLAPGSSFTTTTTGIDVFADIYYNWRIGWLPMPGITFNYMQDGGAGAGEVFLVQVVTKVVYGGLCISNGQYSEQSDLIRRVDVADNAASPIYDLPHDSPRVGLSNDFSYFDAEQRFDTYLFFKSSKAGAHPVAIRQISWGWKGRAHNWGGGGTWQLDGNSVSHSTNPGSWPIFELPTWHGRFTFTSPPPCDGGGGTQP